ncbi:MAG: hypothetical protein ABEJ27_05235 [Halodesulfurarchaeum sp.]
MGADNRRSVIHRRLREDLGEYDEIDVRSAIFCGEMGCGEREQEILVDHPDLRCPYMDRVENPSGYCRRLRSAYTAAVSNREPSVESEDRDT